MLSHGLTVRGPRMAQDVEILPPEHGILQFLHPGLCGIPSWFTQLWTYSFAWLTVLPSPKPPVALLEHSMLPVWAMMLVIQPAYSQTGEWQEVRAKGWPAQPRAYHSAVWVDSLKGMLVLGGWTTKRTGTLGGRADQMDRYLTDLLLYHPDSNEWRNLSPISSARMSHTAVWVDRLSGMLVFGGLTLQGWDVVGLNDVHLYLPGTNTWQQLSPTGFQPRIRSGHSAVWIDRLKGMLIFGGWTCEDDSDWGYYDARCWELNDLHLYLSETNEWQELSPNSTAPKARSHHSAVWIDGLNGMVILGGEFCPHLRYTVWECEQLSDMHLYLPEANEWQELRSLSGYQAHSALWVEALNRMVVFGGFRCWMKSSVGYSCLNRRSMFLYNPETNTWESFSASSAESWPSGRAGHSTVWLDGLDSGANGILVFGGFSIKDGGGYPQTDLTWTFLNELRLYNSTVDLDEGYDAGGVASPGIVASLLLSIFLL